MLPARRLSFHVVKGHLDVIDILNHMIIRDHISTRIDHDSRAHSIDLSERIRPSAPSHARCGSTNCFLPMDIDHRRRGTPDALTVAVSLASEIRPLGD